MKPVAPLPPPPLFPFLVTVYERVPTVPSAGGSYLLQAYGFGGRTLEAACAEGSAYCKMAAARSGREHVGVVDLACTMCHGQGIKPGCKRKGCPTCHGKGVLPIPAPT